MISTTLSPEASLDITIRLIAGSLAKASWPGLRRLKVEAINNAIHLSGDVTTFYEKQQAYQWARRLAGRWSVQEEIDVVSRRSQPVPSFAGAEH